MDRRRRSFVRAGAFALLAASLPGYAQRSGSLPRIGYLTPGNNPREGAFWSGMRDLGYVEGKSILVERRSAQGDFARLPALALEITRSRPDVLVAITTAAAIALKEATSTIPIVMVGASDPVATSLVTSLAHPGGNITGTSSQSASSWRKIFDVLRQLLPGAKRVAVFWDPINAVSQQLRLGETLIAASKLQVLVRVVEVHTREELERGFESLAAWRPDAVLVPGDTFFVANAARVAELGRLRRLPVFSTHRVITEAGALASYGANLDVVSRRAAWYVQRILRGARPGDLAVELPTKFELVVNLPTARAIGLDLPASALAYADDVIR